MSDGGRGLDDKRRLIPYTDLLQASCARVVSSHTVQEISKDENFILKCAGRGILSMTNARPSTNSSQVFLLLTRLGS